ncbi:DnaJ like protein [Ceratobasidium theobromae]|uniref:DnaJ like protein n=1 Tax=Ceratobasidium theobromae TaxID=1582974 RepID=A0A5N5QKG2_9AGAM|nr:DnaJ like protein [Ceratobasidium theobromae]
MVVDTHFYEILGVSTSATSAEIKRAYKKKALQSHPDKARAQNNPNNPDAAQNFQELSTAYETLIDDHTRAHYDRHGWGGPHHSRFDDDIGMDQDEFAYMFEAMFGEGGRRRPGGRNTESTIPYEVTLEELYAGKSVKMNMTRNIICLQCNGSGSKSKAVKTKCSRCEGTGLVTIGVSRTVCPDCDGVGSRLREKDRCKKCKGAKTVSESKKIEFTIKKGMSNGTRITLAGQGDQEPGRETSDLVFILRTKEHSSFSRSGADLMITISITLSEALTGFNRVLLTHLDGRGIRVVSKPNKLIRSGEWIKVPREGMPIPDANNKGDLYILFQVEMPDNEWLKGLDKEALARLLPPKKSDVQASIITDANYEDTDLKDLDGNDDWDNDDDDGDDPECRHQ